MNRFTLPLLAAASLLVAPVAASDPALEVAFRDVDAVLSTLEPGDLYQLMDTAQWHGEPAVRERALLTAWQAAQALRAERELQAFVELLLQDEELPAQVQGAALSLRQALRDAVGFPSPGNLDARVYGSLRPGEPIILRLDLLTRDDVPEVHLALDRAVAVDEDGQVLEGASGVAWMERPFASLSTRRGVPSRVGFELQLDEPGRWLIRAEARISHDELDWDTLERTIEIVISEEGGHARVLEALALDGDGDRVPDGFDLCRGSGIGESVDAEGCTEAQRER